MDLTIFTSRRLLVALTLYLTSLFAANTLGLKLMPFLFGTHLSVAVFSFPIVFIMTDVVGEVFGKETAKSFVIAGFLSNLVFLIYAMISLAMPWSHDASWVQGAYGTVFGITARITIASLVAYIVAEYQDVLSFFFFKARFGSRHFWLRSLMSNIWSQFLDSVLFMSIAFIGVYSWPVLITTTLSWWVYKVAMGFAFTPLSYLGIRWLRGEKKQIQKA